MKLPRTQAAVLNAATPTEDRPIEELTAELDADRAAVTQAAFELEGEGLLAVTTATETTGSPTEEGGRYAEDRLPEIRLYEAALAAS